MKTSLKYSAVRNVFQNVVDVQSCVDINVTLLQVVNFQKNFISKTSTAAEKRSRIQI